MTHSAPDTAPADLRPGWGSWLGVLLPVLCFLVAMTIAAGGGIGLKLLK
jgi:hypothetical protein